MKPKERVLPAGEFKAKCLAVLDDVAAGRGSVLVTKRGRPVARVVPVSEDAPRSLLGSVLREDDLVSPLGEAWSVDP